MINNSYYSQEVHSLYALHDLGSLALEEGGTIRDCKCAYATFDTLNTTKDNAIVNQIGNSFSTSPHNTPAPAGMGQCLHARL